MKIYEKGKACSRREKTRKGRKKRIQVKQNYSYKSIDKLSLREQGSMSMKTELLYKAKKE